ncbi:hypothetical protein BH09MYX1_BH09MYX1_53200 [soil metagenome]
MIRLATASDAESIAEVQVASWHAAYRGIIDDDVLAKVTVAARGPRWRKNLSETETRGARITSYQNGTSR